MAIRPGKKRANLRDVAQASGVSVATVSRVLNAPAKVNTDTRKRVEAKIAELGFMRSAAARAINSGRSKILGALIPTLESDIFAQTINAIETRLADFGLSLIVATTGDDRAVEAQKAQELLDIGVEGFFLSGVTYSAPLEALISRTGVPTVAISYYDPSVRLPTIGYDNAQAAQLAAQHLVGLGHRRIAVVHGPTANNDRTRARLSGIEMYKADANWAFFDVELSMVGGSHAAIQILQSGIKFDAILCASDVMAYGAIFELQRAGVRVPEGVSVMGIQDMPASSVIEPRLTTIELPARDMGMRAAEALAGWVEDNQRPAPMSLPIKLVERASTMRKK